jgi:PAS domain S-box-containing protein
MIAPLPPDEEQRLKALDRYEILDTEPEPAFDDLARLAAQVCGTPIALISLVDPCRQWFKAKVGLTACEGSRDIAFCAHAILQRGLVVVPDTLADERFADNPLVTGDPMIRFYAGAPLVTPDGQALGTLCVIDRTPRQLSGEQQAALAALGRQVMSRMDLRLRNRELGRTIAAEQSAAAAQARLHFAIDHSLEGIALLDRAGRFTRLNPAFAALYGFDVAELTGRPWQTVFSPAWVGTVEQTILPILCQRRIWQGEVVGERKSGAAITIDASLSLLPEQDRQAWLLWTCRDATVRKRAIEEMKRAQQKLLDHQRNLNDAQRLAHLGSWEWEIETGAVLWSDEQYRIFGYEPGAVVPTYELFIAAVYEDDRDRVTAAVERTLREDAPYDLTCRMRGTDGIDRFIHCRGTVIRSRDGCPLKMVGTTLDVTERLRTDEALRISEARTRLMIDTALDAVIGMDASGHVMEWNRRAESIFGWTRDEACGKLLADLIIPPRFRNAHTAGLQRFMATRETRTLNRHVETTAVRRDGTEFPVEVAVTAIEVAGQMCFNAFLSDITARKRTEEALRASEERFHLAVKGSSDGIWDWNVVTNEVYYSPRFKELLDYADYEVAPLFDSFTRYAHPDDRDRVMSAVYDHLHGTMPLNVEVRLRKKQGGHRWFRIRGQAIWDEGGKPVRVAGSLTDIHKDKSAEEELAKAAVELERQNAQLLEARDQALAATQAKSDFLAAMSHEIRTPMNAIVGMADLLAESPLTQEQQAYVRRLSRAAAGLLDLINDILDLSKIESGYLKMETIPFDLPDLVETTADMLALRAHAKGLELVTDIDPALPAKVLGDPTRLRQILVNLIGNAIKFTERGEVVIRVKGDAVPLEPDLLRFSVADTGIGIAEDKLYTIFDRFTQADSSTTRRYGGTGLGLAISKRLAELMGGTILAESVAGLGATFHVRVRLPPATVEGPEPDGRPPDLTGRRILVVDGNQSVRHVIRQAVTHLNGEVMEAADGPAACEVLRRSREIGQQVHLVIVDRLVAGPSSTRMAEDMRSLPEFSDLPAILMTSSCGSGEEAPVACAEEAACLSKPVRRQALLGLILSRLGSDHGKDPEPMRGGEGQPAPLDLMPLRILVAEDLEDNREVIRLFLKDRPWTLDFAENGVMAVQRFKAMAYDLVFMDVQMPELDGYDATRMMREWEQAHGRPRTPIVALTANALQEEIEKSLAAGCDAHMTKPIKKKTLLAAVARYGLRLDDQGASL